MSEIEVFGNEFLNNKNSVKTIESEGNSYNYYEDEMLCQKMVKEKD